MKITIYTTPTCPYCHMAKDFFSETKIDFEEIDVSKDQEKAEEMVKLSGQMGVPVIRIDDEIIIGFDKERIASLITNHS